MARTIANDYNEKKTNILHQAASLFVAEGFSRVSMAQLAEACEISKSNLYHYYTDKEAILFGLLDGHMDEILSDLQQVASQKTDKQLKAFILALLKNYRNADQTHCILLNDLKILQQSQQKIIRQKERLIVQFFKQAVLIEHPAYLAHPDLLTTAVMTMLGSINWSFTWFKDDKGLSIESYANFIANLFEKGLSPSIEAINNKPQELFKQ